MRDTVPEPVEDSDDDDNSQIGYEIMDEDSPFSFEKLVADMVATGYSDGHPAENVLLEIKGLKFGHNKVFGRSVSFNAVAINIYISFAFARLFQTA